MNPTRYFNVVTNLSYLVVGVLIYPLGTLQAFAALALAVLAFGSARYHYSDEHTDAVLDRLGMLSTLVVVAMLGLSQVLPQEVNMEVLTLVAVFLVGLFHERVYSNLVVVVLALIPLSINIVLAGLAGEWIGEAWLPFVLFLIAGVAWAIDEKRHWNAKRKVPGPAWNILHGIVWHVCTAAAWYFLVVQLSRVVGN